MSVSLTSTSTTTTLSSNGVDVFSVGSDNEAQARVNGVMQPLSDLASVGIGQTWQDVSASRTHTTTYTNTTGRPILVAIGVTVSTTRQVTVDGIIVGHFSAGAGYGQCSFIVPHNSQYRINGSISSLVYWAELK